MSLAEYLKRIDSNTILLISNYEIYRIVLFNIGSVIIIILKSSVGNDSCLIGQ